MDFQVSSENIKIDLQTALPHAVKFRCTQGTYVATLNVAQVVDGAGLGVSYRDASVRQGLFTKTFTTLSPTGLFKIALGQDASYVASSLDPPSVAVPCLVQIDSTTYPGENVPVVKAKVALDSFTLTGLLRDLDSALKFSSGELVSLGRDQYRCSEDIYELIARPVASVTMRRAAAG